MAQSAASYFAPVGSTSPADLLRQPSRTARVTPEPGPQSGSQPLSAFEPTFRQKVRQDRSDEPSELTKPSDRAAPEKEREAADRAPASEDESASDADPRESGAAEAQESPEAQDAQHSVEQAGDSGEAFEIAPVGSAGVKLPAATLATNQDANADAKPAPSAATTNTASAEPLTPIDPRTGLPLPGRADVRRELKAAETTLNASAPGTPGTPADEAAGTANASVSGAATFDPLKASSARNGRGARPATVATGSERAGTPAEPTTVTEQSGASAQEQPEARASVLRQSVEAERATGASQSRGDGQAHGGQQAPQSQSFPAFSSPGHAGAAPDASNTRAAGESASQAADGAGKGAAAIKGADTGVFQLKHEGGGSPKLGAGGARGAESGQRAGASNPQPDGAAGMVARGLSASVLQRGGTMNISLIPETLGQVRVEMTLNRGVVGVTLEASSVAAQDLLESSLPMLRSTLESKGLSVERLSVHLSPQAALASASGGADGASTESKDQNSNSPQPGSRGAAADHDAGGGASRGRRDGEHREGSFAGGSGGVAVDAGGAQDESPLTKFRLALNAIA